MSSSAVLSSVTPAEIGKASGIFNMPRYLGGAFGVALLGATFASRGSFSSADTFTTCFVAAMGIAAVLSLIGAVAGSRLPSRAPDIVIHH